MVKNYLDKTYIGLNKMRTKIHGTKIIWTKLAWEKRVCCLKDFVPKKKKIGQNCIGLSWPRTKCCGHEVFDRTFYRT